jgi:hypothetical protein
MQDSQWGRKLNVTLSDDKRHLVLGRLIEISPIRPFESPHDEREFRAQPWQVRR